MSISTIHAADITVGEACTLADAIAAANADEPRGGCPAGNGADVITLTEDIAIAGMLPPTSSPIIIQGRGYTLSGAKRDRILRVVASQLTIHDLTLTGGKREPDFGGAIRVDSGASLRVFDSFFQDNVALSGGAIASFGQLEITNTTFKDNRAALTGGAIFLEGGGLSVNVSVFESNKASRGGAINFTDGMGSVADSHFTGNKASNDGGGVAINEATLTIADSILQGNRAQNEGGAIYSGRSRLMVTKSSLLNNYAGEEGGALKSWRDTVDISESVISGNTAERDGGGISSQSEHTTIHASIISDNSGNRGGGLSASGGILRISGSIFSGNRAYWYGGAIQGIVEELSANNSTFYRNRAVHKAGGLFLKGESELTHITITRNSAAEFGGLYLIEADTRLVNSILAGNSNGDCQGALVENINNLIEDGTCDPALQGDPQLAGLWGSPAVIVPASDSPVIDAGDQSRCIAIDQLGRHRAWGETCDLGAFEVDPSQELLLASLDAPESTAPQQDPVAGIVVNEQCSLADAIKSANRGWAVGGCPAGNAGPDTITLTADVTLSARLPGIGTDITIEGAGHTISGANRFPIFQVFPGPLTVNDLTMTEGRGVGGAAINATDGFITINRSKVIGNRSVGDILAHGGGIFCFPCTLVIMDSLIANNSTNTSGGGIAWQGWDETNYLEIHNSVIEGNSGRRGGGLSITGHNWTQPATIRNTSISRNIAEDDGGGIEAGFGSEASLLDISNSAVVGNRAGRNGGGIFANGDTRLTQVTLAGNMAESGGGLFTANEGATRLTHVTVAGNIAESGGGIYTLDEGAIQLRFSIIAGNSGNDCVGYPEHNIAGLIGDGSCDSMLMGDPMLAELVEPEVGGTAYFPLAPGSPAIDGAFDAQCDGFDQIGTPRPQGAACDIGAIEYVPGLAGEE
ncbi:MAG: hypothetical protein J4G18_16435 [Anaerolineae bacterium]|nr:hypothetical protein [Anaerolineae bacterium]